MWAAAYALLIHTLSLFSSTQWIKKTAQSIMQMLIDTWIVLNFGLYNSCVLTRSFSHCTQQYIFQSLLSKNKKNKRLPIPFFFWAVIKLQQALATLCRAWDGAFWCLEHYIEISVRFLEFVVCDHLLDW